MQLFHTTGIANPLGIGKSNTTNNLKFTLAIENGEEIYKNLWRSYYNIYSSHFKSGDYWNLGY